MASKRLLYTLSLIVFVCLFSFSCKKGSTEPQQDVTYVDAKINNSEFKTNYCELFPMNNFWIVYGYSYKTTASQPLYPQIQLWLRQYSFDTGSYYLGTDSITAFYFPSPTDTVQAVSGIIKVTVTYPAPCGGIGGTFNLILKDGTVVTNGAFLSGPACGTL